MCRGARAVKVSIKGKIETIKKLNEVILDMLEQQEDVESEIETSSEFTSEIYGGLAAIDDVLKKTR